MDVKFLKEKASILITKISKNFGWADLDKDKESEILDRISISDDNCTLPSVYECEGIFDLLGVYKKLSDNQEGKIILYNKCIRSYAESLYERISSELKEREINNEEECVELIYTIVLWHEIGHWVTHWMKDSSGNRWDDSFWKLRPNPNDFLEGLAQLITYYAIDNESNDGYMKKLNFIFEDLLTNQPDPYKQHKEIMNNRNFSWEINFTVIELVRDLLTKCDTFEVSEWDIIKKTTERSSVSKRSYLEDYQVYDNILIYFLLFMELSDGNKELNKYKSFIKSIYSKNTDDEIQKHLDENVIKNNAYASIKNYIIKVLFNEDLYKRRKAQPKVKRFGI